MVKVSITSFVWAQGRLARNQTQHKSSLKLRYCEYLLNPKLSFGHSPPPAWGSNKPERTGRLTTATEEHALLLPGMTPPILECLPVIAFSLAFTPKSLNCKIFLFFLLSLLITTANSNSSVFFYSSFSNGSACSWVLFFFFVFEITFLLLISGNDFVFFLLFMFPFCWFLHAFCSLFKIWSINFLFLRNIGYFCTQKCFLVFAYWSRKLAAKATIKQ